jgi:hypothetical protein
MSPSSAITIASGVLTRLEPNSWGDHNVTGPDIRIACAHARPIAAAWMFKTKARTRLIPSSISELNV